jgi:hypothetical protein
VEHQFGKLGVARLEGLDQLGPLVLGACQRVLIKGRPERRRDMGRSFLPTQASALRMKCTRQRWMAAPSTLAAAPFRPLWSSVARQGMFTCPSGGDDRLDATKAAIGQRPQEFAPEHLGLAWLDSDAQNPAPPVQIDCNSHYCNASTILSGADNHLGRF